MKYTKKYLFFITTLFQAIFLSLNVNAFSARKNTCNTNAFALAQEDEIISQNDPESLDDLQNAGDGQLNYWAEHLSSFDGRQFGYITPARDQFSKNTCWAFAAVGAAEANILRKGIDENATRENLDLDETITAYNRHTRDGNQDPLLLTTNDTYNYGTWNQGDSGAANAFSIMTQGYTLLKENSFSSYVSEDEIKSKLEQSKYYVQSYQSISNERNEIKRAILKYGAVAFNYCAPTSNRFYSLKAANHTSIIIGWDDNVKSSEFSPLKPNNDGAWIIKNSWGNYRGYNSINGTYCYEISYELPIGALYTVDLAMREDYQNIYHYDGDVTISLNKNAGEAQAAIYEAKLSSPTKQEQLKAVMIYVRQDDLDVDVKIYKNLTVNPGNVNDKMNIPVQKMPVAEVQKHIDRIGMHTIDLNEPINLEQGEYFSIVVRCKTKYNVPVSVNCALDSSASTNDMTYYLQDGKWISFKNSNFYADSSTDNRSAKIRAITNVVKRENNLGNDLKYARVEISNRLMYYKKDEEIIPEIKVYFDDELLKQNQDYNVTIEEKSSPGMKKITISGIGNYQGNRITSFEIAKAKFPPEMINDPIIVYNDTISLRDILLPDDWKFNNENQVLEEGSNLVTIVYVGKDKDFYQNLTNNIYINKINQDPPAEFDIEKADVIIEDEYFYTGQMINPKVKVIYENKELRLDTDYTLTFQDNINAGKATILINGKGRYYGQLIKEFEIKQALWPKEKPDNIIKINRKITNLNQISLNVSNWIWKTANLDITNDNFVAEAIYIGEDKDNYVNTSMQITIIRESPKDISLISELKLEKDLFVFNGSAIMPNIIAKDEDLNLVIGVDFEVEYINNTFVGQASVIIKGINNYSGSKTLNFTIIKADRNNFKVIQEGWTYKDENIPNPIIEGEIENAHVTYLYSNEENGIYEETRPVEAGTYWIKAIIDDSTNCNKAIAISSFTIKKASSPEKVPNSNIIINRKIKTLKEVDLIDGWSWEDENIKIDKESIIAYALYFDQKNYENYRIAITISKQAPKDISQLDVNLKESTFVYDGKIKTPNIIAKDENLTLSLGLDYDVEYQNNKFAGQAKAIVTFKNDYKGTIELPFTISKAEQPNVDTIIHFDKKATKLSDIPLPNDFVWEDENMEITSNKLVAKAIYIGEDANSYKTKEIYFEIILDGQINQSNNNLKTIIIIFISSILFIALIVFVIDIFNGKNYKNN